MKIIETIVAFFIGVFAFYAVVVVFSYFGSLDNEISPENLKALKAMIAANNDPEFAQAKNEAIQDGVIKNYEFSKLVKCYAECEKRNQLKKELSNE